MSVNECPLFGEADTFRRVYLLGLGGSGMMPLCHLLRDAGYEVGGWDDDERLRKGDFCWDALPFSEHWDCVIHSSAIPADHEALMRARLEGLPIFRRGDVLAGLSQRYRTIGVLGSHGKTTTTAMLVWLMKQAGVPLNYLVGGEFQRDALRPGGFCDEAEWFVCELDESDGSHEGFALEVAVVTGCDWDHPTRYGSRDDFVRSLREVLSRVKGTSLCWEEGLEGVYPEAGPVFTFGHSASASIHFAGSYEGDLFLPHGQKERVWMPYGPRSFNRLNGLAALGALWAAGISIAGSGLSTFPGCRRRQEVLFSNEHFSLIQDFAHHPSELRALHSELESTMSQPLRYLFQPHRFSRTKALAGCFAEVLDALPLLGLVETYSAGEQSEAAGKAEMILAKMKSALPCPEVLKGDEVMNWLLAHPEFWASGTLVMAGAGNIGAIAGDFAKLLSSSGDEVMDRFFHAWVGKHPDTVLRSFESLEKRTTLRLPGVARWLVEPASREDLWTVLSLIKILDIPWTVLGRGSNLLIAESLFKGVVIRLQGAAWDKLELLPDGRIYAGAGVRMKALAGAACKWGLAGLEFLEGIPGTVGGGLRMNAGAMGSWVFDRVESMEWLTVSGEWREDPLSALNVGYRSCHELSEGIALGAIFRPSGKDLPTQIRQRMNNYADKRKRSQPRESSAGCIFKNPSPETPAGMLIDQSGLKGSRVGDAEVSGIHGNFIINRGHATPEQVLTLLEDTRTAVRRKTGIDLETEVLVLRNHKEKRGRVL